MSLVQRGRDDDDDLVEVKDEGMDVKEDGVVFVNGDADKNGTPDVDRDEDRNDDEDALIPKYGYGGKRAAFVTQTNEKR